MSLEMPPAREEEQAPPSGSLDPEVGELLRRLLVGELALKVDPVSGKAVAGDDSPASKVRP